MFVSQLQLDVEGLDVAGKRFVPAMSFEPLGSRAIHSVCLGIGVSESGDQAIYDAKVGCAWTVLLLS